MSDSSFDLVEHVAPFLDRHLLHVMLKSLTGEEVRELDREILSKTLLVEDFEAAGGDACLMKKQLAERKTQLGNNEGYDAAKLAYDSGDYKGAVALFDQIIPAIPIDEPQKIASLTWGKLAALILCCDYVGAAEEFGKLQKMLDQRKHADALTELNNRTWLIHWSLFIFFNIEGGIEKLIDMFFSSQYMSTIQSSCPWVLRYLIFAVVVSGVTQSPVLHQRKLRDLVRVVNQEVYEYSDDFFNFITTLYVDYDLEHVASKLEAAEKAALSDPFVSYMADVFAKEARYLIADVYCRAHNRIDVARLSRYVLVEPSQISSWLNDLISSSRIKGTFDKENNMLLMNVNKSSVLEQVLDKSNIVQQRSLQVLSQAQSKRDSQTV